MSDSALFALLSSVLTSAVVGAVISGVIALIVARQQISVAKAQLEAMNKQVLVMQDQIRVQREESHTQYSREAIQRALPIAAEILVKREQPPSPEAWSDLRRRWDIAAKSLHLSVQRGAADQVTNRIRYYLDALKRFIDGHMSFEELERLRHRTVDELNGLISPL